MVQLDNHSDQTTRRDEQGEPGVPSKGRAFRVKTVDILRFENGKAVEHWGVTDTGAMMQQLTGEGAEAK